MPNSKNLLHQQLQLLSLMYFSYAVTMLLKISVVFISPALIDDPQLGMTKTQFGSIMAAGSLGGVLGKFFFGWFADKYGGKTAFLISLILISSGIILFGLADHIVIFTVTYFTVNFSKSAGWSSMAKLIENWYQPSQYGRVWGVISTSSRTGAIAASLVLGSLLYILNWHQVLWCAGGIGCLTLVLWILFIREKPEANLSATTTDSTTKNSPSNEVREIDSKSSHHLADSGLLDALKLFVCSKRVWLIFIAMFGLTILTDFLNFVPILLKETLKLSSAKASMTTSAFPIGAFVSVLLGGYYYDKLKSKSITRVMGIQLVMATICLTTMLVSSNFELTENTKVILYFTCLLIFGFSIAPAYYLPMSVFSIKFGGRHSGVLISILDAGGFTASMLFSILAGIVADQVFGWSKVLILLIIIAILTAIVLVWFLDGESKMEDQKTTG